MEELGQNLGCKQSEEAGKVESVRLSLNGKWSVCL